MKTTTLLAAILLASAGSQHGSTKSKAPQAGHATAKAEHKEPVRVDSAPLIEALKKGNARFEGGKSTFQGVTPERRKEVAKGQKPKYTILTCADSRVSPEFIFDRGIGELFVVRVAGNVADTDEIGTIEYGVGHLHTPLLVVLGHSNCGAVKAVLEDAEVGGSIPDLVDNVAPAVYRAKNMLHGSSVEAILKRAVAENVYEAIKSLRVRSEEVRHLEKEGALKIQGAIYDLETGHVSWLEPR